MFLCRNTIHASWNFVRVFQYLHEHHGNMDSASLNLLFQFLKFNPPSRSQGYGLFSLQRLKNKIFHFHIDSWKDSKEHYLLVNPLYPLSHNELCIIPYFSSTLVACSEWRRRLWSLYHLYRKAKDYSISYDALIDAKKGYKRDIAFLF